MCTYLIDEYERKLRDVFKENETWSLSREEAPYSSLWEGQPVWTCPVQYLSTQSGQEEFWACLKVFRPEL